jgi:hypothetical protein
MEGGQPPPQYSYVEGFEDFRNSPRNPHHLWTLDQDFVVTMDMSFRTQMLLLTRCQGDHDFKDAPLGEVWRLILRHAMEEADRVFILSIYPHDAITGGYAFTRWDEPGYTYPEVLLPVEWIMEAFSDLPCKMREDEPMHRRRYVALRVSDHLETFIRRSYLQPATIGLGPWLWLQGLGQEGFSDFCPGSSELFGGDPAFGTKGIAHGSWDQAERVPEIEFLLHYWTWELMRNQFRMGVLDYRRREHQRVSAWSLVSWEFHRIFSPILLNLRTLKHSPDSLRRAMEGLTQSPPGTFNIFSETVSFLDKRVQISESLPEDVINPVTGAPVIAMSYGLLLDGTAFYREQWYQAALRCIQTTHQ